MKNIIFTLILLFLISCNGSKEPEQKISLKVNSKLSTDTLKDRSLNEVHIDTFIIVTSDYNFKDDYYGINLIEYNLNGNKLTSNKKDLNFGKYKDVLMGGKYNTSGAYYPVQFDLEKRKIYLSVYKADEMEGTFDYNKILEYDLQNDSIREIISLSDYFYSWFFSKVNNKIYGFDNSSKSLISINTNNSRIDTLHTFTTYVNEIIYQSNNEKTLDIIVFNKENGVIKFNINYANDSFTKTNLYQISYFSSYHNGIVVSTYKDFNKNTEELRIYNGSHKKSISYDFKNFSTFWINDSEFLTIKDDKIQKINTDLVVVDEFKKDEIHIIDVISNSIIVSFNPHNNRKIGILDFEFNSLIEINDIKPNEVVVVKDK